MKAIVKSMWIDSPTTNLNDYWPDDPEYFGTWIEFRVGPENEVGADDFRLYVCTPNWIKERCRDADGIWGRSMLIISKFDLSTIESEISLMVNSCTGSEWSNVARKIARFAAWEFEDYQS